MIWFTETELITLPYVAELSQVDLGNSRLIEMASPHQPIEQVQNRLSGDVLGIEESYKKKRNMNEGYK